MQYQLEQLESASQQLDARLAAFRQEVARNEDALKHQLSQEAAAMVSAACRDLHVQLDKEVEDKIYMVERANQAQSLSRKSEQLAAGAAAAGEGSNYSGARPEDLRALKSELGNEIKKNLSAMHALLEEKLKSVLRKAQCAREHAPLQSDSHLCSVCFYSLFRIMERKSAVTSSEYSRSLGSSLRELEEKSRAAEDFLLKAQDLYHTLQRQVQAEGSNIPAREQQPSILQQGAPATISQPAMSTATAPSSSSSGASSAAPSTQQQQQQQQQPTRHRPASPTIYLPPNTAAAPPVAAAPVIAAPLAPSAFDVVPHAQHPPAFAAALPYYHDPRDPAAPFLAHASRSEGAYVPPARDAPPGPSRIHQYPPHQAGAASSYREDVIRQAEVRKAADAALTRALSPLRHRSSSPPTTSLRSPSLLDRFGSSPIASIHHHTASDDLDLPQRQQASKPYALIPSHFPPAAAASSFFDAEPVPGHGHGHGRRSLDDSDLAVHDRAMASGLGNIDQLLRSMDFMESVEGRNKKTTNKTRAKGTPTHTNMLTHTRATSVHDLFAQC